jgi:hypothetical protein
MTDKTFFIPKKSNYMITELADNYEFGYKKLATLSAEFLDSIDGGKYDDTMRIPTLYLYRQYIELRLKKLCRLYEPALEEDTKSRNKTLRTHSLKAIWDELLKLIDMVWESRNVFEGGEIEDIELVVSSFHNYDPYAQFFRYEKNIKGEVHKTFSFDVDYKKLSSAMDNAEDAFDSLELSFQYNLNQ